MFKRHVVGLISVSLMVAGPLSSMLSSSIQHAEATPNIALGRQDSDISRLFHGYFTENRGQVAEGVRYYSTGNPSVAFRDDGVMFVLRQPVNERQNDATRLPNPLDQFKPVEEPTAPRSSAYVIRFEGATLVAPVGVDRLPFDSNFFIGNDSDKWRTGVPNYGEVVYKNLYHGIDLVYLLSPEGVKYEFAIAAGADPGVIRMRYDGIESLEAKGDGLLIRTALGVVTDFVPRSYEEGGGEVRCAFAMRAALTYGFNCERQDTSRKLVIDPLIYSTFLGGGSNDSGSSIAVDSTGDAYVTGWTDSTDFPVTPGVYDGNYNGGRDIFLAKLNAAGDSLVYSSYIGGGRDDLAESIAVDPVGNAYVTGVTYSNDFPATLGAYSTAYNGGESDAFVTKLNPGGSVLVYSTFLGGSDWEVGLSIALDSSNRAYVTGETNSTSFPVTAGAFNRTHGGGGANVDAFVTKLNATGTGLVYSTFLGGGNMEQGNSIKVDSSGDAFVAGRTSSTDFPVTPDARFRSYGGGDDAFVTELDPIGGALVYSTFLGGSDFDSGNSIALDLKGNAYVAGTTRSTDFPTTVDAYRRGCGGAGYDVFVTKFNNNGSFVSYSTCIGPGGGSSIALDSADNAYLTGTTLSATFPTTPGAFDTNNNGLRDAFVTRLNAAGSALIYSTYLGGGSNDWGISLAVDSGGSAYVTGETWSIDFPITPGAFSTAHNGGPRDVFVTKFYPAGPDLAISPADMTIDPSGPVTSGTLVTVNATVHNIGGANASSVIVRFYDGPPSAPNQIGTDQVIPLIQALGGMGNVSVVWSALPSGTHDICVLADPDDVIVEENETNNQACGSIEVTAPPMPDLSLSASDITLYPAPPYVQSSSVQVNATVRNVGRNASGTTAVRFHDGAPPSPRIETDQPLIPILAGGAENASVVWTASPPGSHEICVIADPDGLVAESNETNNTACVSVLVNPAPVTRPDYIPISPQPLPPIKVGLHSPVSLSIQVLNHGNGTATDDATVAFHEQSSPPFSTFTLVPLAPATTSSRFTATWTSPAIPGTYLVSVDVDHDNNVTEWDETNNIYTWTIEVVSGPLTSLLIGSPNYTSASTRLTYVRSSTHLDFSVADQSGLGIRNTTYRIDGGDWANYTATGQFVLAGEGQHTLEWHSEDYAGNMENASFANLTVDNTPPSTAISPATGDFTNETQFNLTAADAGSGVDRIDYRIDGGAWIEYSGNFTLPAGHHNIHYRAVDNLGNIENEKSIEVNIGGGLPPPAVEANYKPLVALVFAIILAVVGLWSSKRMPWKGGKDRRAVVKSFLVVSLPFVVAEAVTGFTSLLTGKLSIPPPIGLGSAVDLTILVLGCAVAIVRVVKGSQRKGK